MARTRAGLPSLVACAPFSALVLFQGMNCKLKKNLKEKNSTPILENSWGLKALNQGNILPSLLWTPLCLRAPQGLFPPLVSGLCWHKRLGRGKEPLLAEVSLPEVASLPLQPHLHQLVEPLKLTTVPLPTSCFPGCGRRQQSQSAQGHCEKH